MNKLRLRLESADLHSSRRDGTGTVVEASFYVHTRDEAATLAVYLFATISQGAYDSWFLENSTEVEPLEEDNIFPLVVPDSSLYDSDLVAYIKRTYLNPATPGRINDVAQFLLKVSSEE